MVIPIPILGVWALAAVALVAAAPAERAVLLFGETWRSCPFNIAFLSVPFFLAAFWAMKGLAPTRLAAAGALAGLLAGSAGALGLQPALPRDVAGVHRHLVPAGHGDSDGGRRAPRAAAAALVGRPAISHGHVPAGPLTGPSVPRILFQVV